MKNTPDRWVVLNLVTQGKPVRKVFAGWYGGYLGSNSWQLNSGNAAEEEFPDRWEFTGVSGSTYICYKACYGMSGQMCNMFENWTGKLQPGESIEIVAEYEPARQPA